MPDEIPTDIFEKRVLLYAKGQEKRRAAVASALVAKGRLGEALEILDRTHDPALLARVRADAIRGGDAYSLARAVSILKSEVAPAEWRDLAREAERRGRWRDAVNALEKAGDAEAAEALRAQRCPDHRPFRPANK